MLQKLKQLNLDKTFLTLNFFLNLFCVFAFFYALNFRKNTFIFLYFLILGTLLLFCLFKKRNLFKTIFLTNFLIFFYIYFLLVFSRTPLFYFLILLVLNLVSIKILEINPFQNFKIFEKIIIFKLFFYSILFGGVFYFLESDIFESYGIIYSFVFILLEQLFFTFIFFNIYLKTFSKFISSIFTSFIYLSFYAINFMSLKSEYIELFNELWFYYLSLYFFVLLSFIVFCLIFYLRKLNLIYSIIFHILVNFWILAILKFL